MKFGVYAYVFIVKVFTSTIFYSNILNCTFQQQIHSLISTVQNISTMIIIFHINIWIYCNNDLFYKIIYVNEYVFIKYIKMALIKIIQNVYLNHISSQILKNICQKNIKNMGNIMVIL